MSPSTTQNSAPRPQGTGALVPPLAELDFEVVVEGRTIGRFAECTGLAVEYDVLDYTEGGNNDFVHRLRGTVRYPNVTLRRGVTNEDALLTWFYAVQRTDQRSTLTIVLSDTSGDPVRQFALRSALPVRWTGPSVSAGSNATASESLEIAHLGFV